MPQILASVLGTTLAGVAASAISNSLFGNQCVNPAATAQAATNVRRAQGLSQLNALGLGRGTQVPQENLAATTAGNAAGTQAALQQQELQNEALSRMNTLMQGSKNISNQNDFAAGYGSGGTGRQGTGYGQPAGGQQGTVPPTSQPADGGAGGGAQGGGQVDPTTGQQVDTTMGGLPMDFAFDPTMGLGATDIGFPLTSGDVTGTTAGTAISGFTDASGNPISSDTGTSGF